MRSCVVLLFASLLTLCEAQGTIVTPVFVLKGRDLLLKLDAHLTEGVLFVDWKINKTVNLVRIQLIGEQTVDPRFTGRVQFGENKFSVILKNVQEVDSGVYSAVAGTLQGDKTAAEYKVTVQETRPPPSGPVSPVELIADRVDSSSSESCDLHVTCRTHNSHISSIVSCFNRVCSQEGGEVTTSGASLQVYLLHNVIICNHSNQVNWILDFNTAEQLCYPSTDSPSLPVSVMTVCVLTLLLTLILIVVLSVWLYKDRRKIIGLTQRCEAKEAVALRIDKEQDARFALLEKHLRSAGASGPSYSSVPSAAEPTDP